MLYGSIEAAKRLLRATEGATFGADADARLTDLRAAASAYIERYTGRTFGTGATSETVAVSAPGVSNLLVLPKGVRTITSVTGGATWNGSAWTGGTVVAATLYRPVYRTLTGEYLALELIGLSKWSGTYVIVGTWEDTDADASVPDDITYAANVLMAEWYKVERASPAGYTGPDGAVVPIRRATQDDRVKGVLDHYRASSLAVAV